MNIPLDNKVLLSLFLIISFSAYSQINTGDSLKIDSLKKVLLKAKEDSNKVNTLCSLGGILLPSGNSEIALRYVKEALSLSGEINYKKGQAKAFRLLGLIYMDEDNYTDGLKNVLLALKINQEIQSKPAIAYSYLAIGDAYRGLDNLVESQKNYYAALKLFEGTGDNHGMSYLYQMIGETNASQGNDSAALNNYLTSLKISAQSGENELTGQTLLKIGNIYFTQGNYTEALIKDSAALKIYREVNHNNLLADGFANMGRTYERLGDLAFDAGDKTNAKTKFSEALKNYLLSLKLGVGDKGGLTWYYSYTGSIYIKLHKLDSARLYLEKSLQISKEIGTADNFEKSYNGIAKLDSAEGNYKQAFEDYKKYILYRDSLLKGENQKKLLQVNMQYEFDKKTAAAKEAQNNKDAEAKRIKNQQYFAIVSLGVLVLAVFVIALIQFRNNKHKQKANLLITQQKEKVETTLKELKATQSQLIQSEKMASLGELTAGIAHEIQNPLNFVNNFSEVNSELIEELQQERHKEQRDFKNEDELLNDIKENERKINHHGKRADAIVKGMLQHSRSSSGVKEPTNINALADEYLKLAYHGMKAKEKTFNATLRTDFDETIVNINTIPQDIGRVFLNLYNNAFYAVTEKKKQYIEGYEPTVSVSTKKFAEKVEIRVKDNGTGISQKVVEKIFQPFFTTKPTGQGTGLGLSLSYDIIKADGGEIKVNTKEGEFTEFVVQLPIVA